MNTKATALLISAIFAATNVPGADGGKPFKDDKERLSYSIGLNVGNDMKRREVEVDYDFLVRGLKDAMAGGEKLLTDEEVRETFAKFQRESAAKQQEKNRKMSEKNQQQAAAFMAENKTKPGIVTTTNGLQYKILTEGSGDSPKPEDTVTVNYRGTLIDGTEFDSSEKRGPAVFRVNGVIRGWTEALTMMKPGAKWQLFIPAELAYGERGSPPLIEPGATLIFDVELMSVQAAPPRTPLTSDIIKVPSLDEMKKGAKIETIKAEDLEKMQKQEQEKKAQEQKKQ